MADLPFIIPEYDLKLRLTRLLILLYRLSFSKKGKPCLTMTKIGMFDFLLRYPVILSEVLHCSDKKPSFKLQESDFGTIESQYPDSQVLFDLEDIKITLQTSIIYRFADVQSTQKEILYVITDEGKQFVESLETTYSQRCLELADAIKPLLSESDTYLRATIKSRI